MALTPEDCSQLIQQAQAGDSEAKRILVECHQPLVASLAQRFYGRGYEAEDLLQVANIGFLKAVYHFDGSFGAKLSTYAVPVIIGELRRYIRDNKPVHVSRSLKELAARAYQLAETLTLELGREPAISELAAAAGVSQQELALALESARPVASLEQPVSGEDGLALGDTLSSQETENDWISSLTMKEALRTLKPREQKLMLWRFFLGRSQMEVAQELGVSQAQVSRLEKQILQKLRTGL